MNVGHSLDQSRLWYIFLVESVVAALAIAPPRREGLGSEFIPFGANVKGAGARSAELMSCYNQPDHLSGVGH